jgi:hypothetical protein
MCAAGDWLLKSGHDGTGPGEKDGKNDARVNHNAFVTGLLSLAVRSWVTEYRESFESYLN